MTFAIDGRHQESIKQASKQSVGGFDVCGIDTKNQSISPTHPPKTKSVGGFDVCGTLRVIGGGGRGDHDFVLSCTAVRLAWHNSCVCVGGGGGEEGAGSDVWGLVVDAGGQNTVERGEVDGEGGGVGGVATYLDVRHVI